MSDASINYEYVGYNTLSSHPGSHYGITLDNNSRVASNQNKETLKVKRTINYIKTGLINFDLGWLSDSTSYVITAFLYLKTTDTAPAGFPISVHKVNKTWTGSIVNWIDRNIAGEWSIVARGALETKEDTDSVPTDTITPTETDTWYIWNVGAIVSDIISNQNLTNNNGFVLRYPKIGGTSTFGETLFHGNNAANNDNKPYLILGLSESNINYSALIDSDEKDLTDSYGAYLKALDNLV
jgi:hypothetical protein